MILRLMLKILYRKQTQALLTPQRPRKKSNIVMKKEKAKKKTKKVGIYKIKKHVN